jgi:hypothetical protein
VRRERCGRDGALEAAALACCGTRRRASEDFTRLSWYSALRAADGDASAPLRMSLFSFRACVTATAQRTHLPVKRCGNGAS